MTRHSRIQIYHDDGVGRLLTQQTTIEKGNNTHQVLSMSFRDRYEYLIHPLGCESGRKSKALADFVAEEKWYLSTRADQREYVKIIRQEVQMCGGLVDLVIP